MQIKPAPRQETEPPVMIPWYHTVAQQEQLARDVAARDAKDVPPRDET
jgi:hypothetical protein